MTEEELLRAAAALGLSVDRALARALLSEVERVRAAAERLHELPLDLACSPFDRDQE